MKLSLPLFILTYRTIIIHGIIWSTAFTAISTVLNSDKGYPKEFEIISGSLYLMLFYLNSLLIYPYLMNRKYWWLYIICFIIIILSIYNTKIFILGLAEVTIKSSMKPGLFLPAIFFFVLSSIYRIIHDNDQYEKRLREQKALQLETELKFLRSQINPHFLFNVLNGLVSMARKKSEHLESSLIELAALIRFMLYNVGNEKVLLSTEIEYLRSYIALQQIRFGEDVKINVEIKEVEQEWKIEPMLLIPFVENAFKHGVGIVPDPYINVRLEVRERTLYFSIENKFNPDLDSVRDANSGIGLSNIKARLDLLYKDQYVLQMKDHDFKFLVNLELHLND